MAKDRPFQMRTNQEWLDRIDNWRREQPSLPARTAAVEELVRLGLEEFNRQYPGDIGSKYLASQRRIAELEDQHDTLLKQNEGLRKALRAIRNTLESVNE